jgi:hypothetical protein
MSSKSKREVTFICAMNTSLGTHLELDIRTVSLTILATCSATIIAGPIDRALIVIQVFFIRRSEASLQRNCHWSSSDITRPFATIGGEPELVYDVRWHRIILDVIIVLLEEGQYEFAINTSDLLLARSTAAETRQVGGLVHASRLEWRS